MAKTAVLTEIKAKLLTKPGVKAEYDRLEPEFIAARAIINARTKAKLTQAQLAERMDIKQPQIAKLEAGRNVGVDTLQRVADATGQKIKIEFQPAA